MKKFLAVATFVFLSSVNSLGDSIADKKGESVKDSRQERIIKVFNELNKDTINSLDAFYHPELDFEDPLGKIKGLPAMKAYYANMYKNVKSIKFEFSKVLNEGDEYVGFWKMYLAAPGLNGGEEFWVEGNSHIRFDPKTDLVIYHRDYFDMGAFIYEQLPILKLVIRQVKKPLAHK
jgi:hypothetical protein